MFEAIKGNKSAIFWTIMRVLLGLQWIISGWNKIGSFDASGFVKSSIDMAQEPSTDVLSWYASFLEKIVLPNIEIFNFLVCWGEFLIGLGLIIGLFTSAALYTGAFLNFNFLLAGASSINPIVYTLEIILLIKRPASTRFSIDYFLLPRIKDKEHDIKKSI